MTLVKSTLSVNLQNFIEENGAKVQEDSDEAIKKYCEKLEDLIYISIKSLTITIPPGTITLVGTSPTGPVTVTNTQPIVLSAPMIS